MIIWIASYPKSGNTWVRMFLASWIADKEVSINEMAHYSLTGSDMGPAAWHIAAAKPADTLTEAEIIRLRPQVHMILADQRMRAMIHGSFAQILVSGSDVFLKTHNAIAEMDGVPTINKDVTKGAVYIVRDPRDVVVSYASHYDKSIDASIEDMEMPQLRIMNSGWPMFHHLGSWSDNVTSWADVKGGVVLLRYEDMLKSPVKEFRKVLKAFKLPAGIKRATAASKRVSFAKMKASEQEFGFRERSKISKDRFFRSGRAGGWRHNLNRAQIARIEAVHGPTMRRMGYEMAA